MDEEYEVFGEEIEDSGEESIDLCDYCDYPFAMEVVNGEIINMSGKLQKAVRRKLLDLAQVTEADLVGFLKINDLIVAENSETGKALHDTVGLGIEELSDLLGFDFGSDSFQCDGISFLGSRYGWEAKDLLEQLGYCMSDDMNYGPHGHGTAGVVYLENINGKED